MEPRCQYFGSCGGCKTQHLGYDQQVENKVKMVTTELDRFKIVHPKPTIITGEPYGYRNRMDFVFTPAGPALRKQGSFKQSVPIKSCPISDQKINALLEEVWAWFSSHKQELSAFDLKRRAGCIKYVVLRAPRHTGDTVISFMLNEDDGQLAAHIDLIKEFALSTSASHVVIARSPKDKDESLSPDCFAVKGETTMMEQLNGTPITFSTQGFFQNNTLMAEKMISYVEDQVTDQDKQLTLVDLYGGSGAFGFTLKDLFNKTIIIDSEGVNIECAKQTISKNDLKDIEAVTADAGAMFGHLAKEGELFLLTDPPRSGMHPKVVKKIIGLKPKTIVYVSCNPRQMARELRHLCGLYTMRSLAVADLFPQTNHVEAIAVLKEK